MNAGNNFVDLRITNAGTTGDSEDSVWPAFTDIMTVILMIFLISMITFLIRNTQLVDELQTTLIAKDQISQQALLSAEENTSLQSQLARVRDRILSLENSLFDIKDEKSKLEDTLEKREQVARDLQIEIALLTKLRDQLSDSNSDLLRKLDIGKQTLLQAETELGETKNTLNEKISLLLAEKAGLTLAQEKSSQALSDTEQERLELTSKVISLTEQLRLINEALEKQSVQLDTQTEQNKSLNTQLEDNRVLMAGLSTNKEELQAKLIQMAEQLKKLQDLYTTRGATVADLQKMVNASDQKFKSLQQEYDSLDQQYRNLIRPARSPAGKYVVDVYFAKQNGSSIYRLKTPEQNTAITLSLEKVHQKLAALKADKKQSLYTKIRIDDKSGIGFNEAWKFTQSMLSQYDYYHNDYSQSSDNNTNGKKPSE